tara:strand:+ start:105 stop:767 length:663 start_codon:yes stop_codon:yes gene_type:complete
MDKRENKSWTKEEEVALLWYYQNGKSNAYMRKKLGRTTFGIASRLSKLRVEIGDQGLKIGSNTWSAEEDATLIRMYEAGASYDDIGFTLGRTAKAAQMRAFNLRKRGQLTEFKSSRRHQPNQLPQMELFKAPEPVREVPNTKVKSKPKPKPKPEPKPKPKPKPKPVVTAEPILMPKRQGWWSRLRHGDQALWLEVERLRAELNVLHASHTKLLSGLGEEE